MKNKFELILILLIFSIACQPQPEEEIILLEQETALAETDDPEDFTETELFVSKMQWTSYFISKAILSDEQTRAEFVDQINISSSFNKKSAYFSVSELLNNNPVFEEKFREMFEYYYSLGGEVYQLCGKPITSEAPKPQVAPGGIALNFVEITSAYDQFIVEITVDNCFEVFIPHGFDAKIKKIVSTAHPMNGSNTNVRYDHVPKFKCAKEGTINHNNAFCLDNVIVIRPDRNDNYGCSYASYDVNFEDFLSDLSECK